MVISRTSAVTTAVTAYSKTLGVLTSTVFPRVVTYATHPLTISATILLLIPLILDASNTSLALVLGNYTNVVSASVSSIVLLQSVQHMAHTKRMHAEHSQEIAKLHEKIDALSPPTPLAPLATNSQQAAHTRRPSMKKGPTDGK